MKFQTYYNHTTVDPPELIYFIRENFPDVITEYPKLTMWELIVKKRLPPTRIIRYCCKYLKENAAKNRTAITGVRWAESARRKASRGVAEKNTLNKKDRIVIMNDNNESRRLIENCNQKGRFTVNPIIDWSDDDVWNFLKKYNYKYCCLYDRGFTRIGCIGCPLAGAKKMKRDFEVYPKYYSAYIRAFDRMVNAREESGLVTIWKDGQQAMDWWIGDYKFPSEDEQRQITLQEYLNIEL